MGTVLAFRPPTEAVSRDRETKRAGTDGTPVWAKVLGTLAVTVVVAAAAILAAAILSDTM
jgi:hypothetical protein